MSVFQQFNVLMIEKTMQPKVSAVCWEYGHQAQCHIHIPHAHWHSVDMVRKMCKHGKLKGFRNNNINNNNNISPAKWGGHYSANNSSMHKRILCIKNRIKISLLYQKMQTYGRPAPVHVREVHYLFDFAEGLE